VIKERKVYLKTGKENTNMENLDHETLIKLMKENDDE